MVMICPWGILPEAMLGRGGKRMGAAFWLATLLCLAAVAGCSRTSLSGGEAAATSALDGTLDFSEPFEVEITGSQERWHVRYPSVEGQPQQGSESLTVHVPVDTRIVLLLKSTDYVYSVALPHLGLHEIAVPELEFRMEFSISAAGEFLLVGDHLCGIAETEAAGRLVAKPQDSFLQWVRQHDQG